MPNWVYNSITLRGDEDKLRAVWDTIVRHDESAGEAVFSFKNLIPVPDEVDYEAEGKSWNLNNWGTKWDAGEVHYLLHPPTYPGENVRSLFFSTAWDQPEPVFTALAELCTQNGIDFTISYEEENGWGGEIEGVSGKITTTTYAEPTSHADYLKRKDACYCERTGERMFLDCPELEKESN